MVIGRDAEADFRIPLTTISRAHVRIVETDNVYVLEDLGSTHGSLINGEKLTKGEKKVLRDGDIIELTKAKITCNIDMQQVVDSDSGENTRMIADKAVQGILGRLGDSQGTNPFIRVLSGPDEGQKLDLGAPTSEWDLGRSGDCQLVLNDVNISRRHALVKRDWNGYLIQDLGSKNGIEINGKSYRKPRRLQDQDEITVGPIKMLFIDPDWAIMAALKDVAGFQQDDEDKEFLEEDPSVMGAPQDDNELEPQDEQEDDLAAAEENSEFTDTNEDYANIDPTLLEPVNKEGPGGKIILGLGLSILVLALILLAAVFMP
jgi:pSer/pThr/pTyr-binding forkhead associated (FHA) protein